MPQNGKKRFYLGAGLLFFNLFALKALADREPINLPNPLSPASDITAIINNVVDYLIGLGAPLLGLMILIGGFRILFARDDPEKIKSGRKIIMWAVIGFAIILISKGVALIVQKILSP